MNKRVSPSVREKAFNCPHCDAYTTQYWFDLYAERVDDDPGIPYVPDGAERLIVAKADIKTETRQKMLAHIDRMMIGEPWLHVLEQSKLVRLDVTNLFVSSCYACKKLSVWVHDRLLYPPTRTGPPPNADLPPDVLVDYEEARSILDLSPRGAAALLRLCIQKLCAFLGEKGKKIDDDIASLVAKGLNPVVQKSLDIVRVIGNEAVHPGEMDLRDDRDTATALFGLVNAITDQMITHPKAVDAMYDRLPPEKRKGIEERDSKNKKGSS